MKQTEEKFWQAWKTFDKNKKKIFLALSENLGASWESLRQTFAFEGKIGGLENYLRQTFALEEKIGGVEIICAKPLRLKKK